jgi:hypothetical protein
MTEHFNKLTPAQAERLALLAEECGEVIQVVGKILRHGFDSTHPEGGRTNRQWLEKELGDVEFAKSLLVENPNGGEPDLNRDLISQAFAEKGMRCFQYLHHNADINQ